MLTTTIHPCQGTSRYFVLENGFRFEFPSFIATALSNYLEKIAQTQDEPNIGEWLLELPLRERMMVSIQMTADRLKKKF